MNYVDRTLVLLADPAGRESLFDEESLARVAAAAYNTDLLPLEPPFRAVFDELQVGFFAPRVGVLEGTLVQNGRPRSTEARFRIAGLGSDPGATIDAFWRGAIVAQSRPERARVVRTETSWPSLGAIDAEIVRALGELPGEPAREDERRTRLLTRLRTALDQPAVFDDDTFDEWLDGIGARSVGDLLTRFQGVVLPGSVSITFSPPSDEPASPTVLPIAAPVLIRDVGFSIADLLVQSKQIRGQLEPLGLSRPRDPALSSRPHQLIIWLVPRAVFDDDDWPGATDDMDETARRTARLDAASKWLSNEGIGVITTA